MKQTVKKWERCSFLFQTGKTISKIATCSHRHNFAKRQINAQIPHFYFIHLL